MPQNIHTVPPGHRFSIQVLPAVVDYKMIIELDGSKFQVFLSRDYLARLADTINNTLSAPKGSF
jgi:hypothetical protein